MGTDQREMEERIGALAAGQHGIVTRGQLLGIGLSTSAVSRRVRAGRLGCLHRGVFQVGPVALAWGTEMAAVMAIGPQALASHLSAASLHAMLDPGVPPRPVRVSVCGSGRASRPGIRVHRIDELADDERCVVHGIPATAPGRTIADLAAELGIRELGTLVARAEREGIVSTEVLASLPDRYRGRPGIGALRALIRDHAGPDFTRSEAERQFAGLVREGRLPRGRANVRVGPYELDYYWPEFGIAIEIDGRAHHSRRPRFEGDRRKDSWLMARGIRVIRLTWTQITRDRMATAVELGQALALAREAREAREARGAQK